MLLVSWGCQKDSAGITPPPPPAVTVEKKQATETQNIAVPAPAESNPEPVKAELPKQSEPNVSIAPPAPLAEPNVKQVVAEPVPPKPAESNITESKPVQPVIGSPAELCKKCTAFLGNFVDKDGFVDYKALLRKKIELVETIDSFKNIDRKTYDSWSQEDKMAFWINAYNLQMTRIILSNYPIEPSRMLLLFWTPNSIRHIKGIWDEHKFIIMGEEFNLKEVEQRVFGKEFNDPRIFLAVSYASVSGPPLRNEAYCGQNLSQQLDDQVKRFLAAGQNVFKIDRENRIVYLSSILKSAWHGHNFLAKYGTDLKFKQQDPDVRAVLNFLTKYITQDQVDFLETANYTVEYTVYDWSLNERGGPKAE